MTRRTLGGLILLTWVGALGWLAVRQYGGVPRAPDGWPVPPGAVFQAIRLGHRQVGYRTFTVDTVPTGLRVTDLMTIDLPPVTPGTIRRTSARNVAFYSKGLVLLNWQTDLLTGRGRSTIIGSVENDTLLRLVTRKGAEAETLQVTARRPVVLGSAVPFVMKSRGMLRDEGRLGVDVLDPFDLVIRAGRYTITGDSIFQVADSAEYDFRTERWLPVHRDTVRAWRVEGSGSALPWAEWVDASGMPVRTLYQEGATLDRSAFELVYQNYRARPYPTWPPDSQVADLLALEPPPLSRRPLTAFAVTRRGGVVGAGAAGPASPTSVASVAADDSSSGRRALLPLAAPESLLEQAVAAAGATSGGPRRRAAALNTWVRRQITLRDGIDLATAGWVLNHRTGTTGERAATLAALARKAGLVASPVWGLVWRNGQWYRHTWVLVEDSAGTFPLDPAESEVPADAGRVALGADGPARLLDLLLKAGELRLEPWTETR